MEILTWLYEGLLYVASFGVVLVLFTSAVGLPAWLLMKFFHWFATDPQATDKPLSPQDRNSHKRAGQ